MKHPDGSKGHGTADLLGVEDGQVGCCWGGSLGCSLGAGCGGQLPRGGRWRPGFRCGGWPGKLRLGSPLVSGAVLWTMWRLAAEHVWAEAQRSWGQGEALAASAREKESGEVQLRSRVVAACCDSDFNVGTLMLCRAVPCLAVLDLQEQDDKFAIVFAAMGVNMETAHFFKQVCACTRCMSSTLLFSNSRQHSVHVWMGQHAPPAGLKAPLAWQA